MQFFISNIPIISSDQIIQWRPISCFLSKRTLHRMPKCQLRFEPYTFNLLNNCNCCFKEILIMRLICTLSSGLSKIIFKKPKNRLKYFHCEKSIFYSYFLLSVLHRSWLMTNLPFTTFRTTDCYSLFLLLLNKHGI